VSAAEDRVLDAMLASLGSEPRWREVNPYLLRYLAAHAARAGRLHVLMTDIGFLIHADPVRLIEVLGTVDARIHAEARLYGRAAHLLPDTSASQRAMILRTTAAEEEPALLPRFPATPPLSARWADARPTPYHRTVLGSAHGLLGVAFTTLPGGFRVVATGDEGGAVRLWDLETMTLRATLPGHSGGARCVAFGTLPDGTVLLAAGDDGGTVRVWDADTLTLISSLKGHTGSVLSLAFYMSSRHGLTLATGDSGGANQPNFDSRGAVRRWDPVSGRLRYSALQEDGRVTALAYGVGQDGQAMLAIGREQNGYGGVRILDPSKPMRKRTSRFGWGIGGTIEVAFCSLPGGALVLIESDNHENELSSWGRLRLWNTSTQELLTLSLGIGLVIAIAAADPSTGQARVALGTADGRILLADPESGDLTADLTGHHGPVTALAFGGLPDGRTLLVSGASGTGDSTVRFWDPAVENDATPQPKREPHVLSARFVALPDDRVLLATGEGYYHGGHHYQEDKDGYIRLRDPGDGTIHATIPAESRRVTALDAVTTADGTALLAAGDTGGKVTLLDPITGTKRARFPVHTGIVHAVVFGRLGDGTEILATGGYDGTVETQPYGRRRAPSGDVWWHYQSEHNRYVAIWNIATEELVAYLEGHTNGGVNAIAVGTTSDGHTILATGGSDIEDGERLNGARIAGAGPDGYWGVDGTVRLWRLDDLTPLADLPGQPGGVVDLAFGTAADGSLMLAACGGAPDFAVDLWDPMTTTLLGSLPGHTDRVLSVAFGALPGGAPILATAGFDRTIRLWDPRVLSSLGSISVSSPVNALAFSGQVLAAGTDRGTIVFDVATQNT
jgi:WD40 repeat protein